MREFKFRAWDGQENKMTAVMSLRDFATTDGIPESWFDEQIYMQYTGLKDRNGVEIFESDILEFADKWECYRGQHSIRFMSITGKELEAAKAKYEAEPMERREVVLPECYEWLLSPDVQSWWKVIGNIYENQELLELDN